MSDLLSAGRKSFEEQLEGLENLQGVVHLSVANCRNGLQCCENDSFRTQYFM